MGGKCAGSRWPVPTGLRIALACLAVTLAAPAHAQGEIKIELKSAEHDPRLLEKTRQNPRPGPVVRQQSKLPHIEKPPVALPRGGAVDVERDGHRKLDEHRKPGVSVATIIEHTRPPDPAAYFRWIVQWEKHVTDRPPDSHPGDDRPQMIAKRSKGMAVELSLRNDKLVVEVHNRGAVVMSGTIDESVPTQTAAFLESLTTISPDVTSDVFADRDAARRLETYGIVPKGLRVVTGYDKLLAVANNVYVDDHVLAPRMTAVMPLPLPPTRVVLLLDHAATQAAANAIEAACRCRVILAAGLDLDQITAILDTHPKSLAILIGHLDGGRLGARELAIDTLTSRALAGKSLPFILGCNSFLHDGGAVLGQYSLNPMLARTTEAFTAPTVAGFMQRLATPSNPLVLDATVVAGLEHLEAVRVSTLELHDEVKLAIHLNSPPAELAPDAVDATITITHEDGAPRVSRLIVQIGDWIAPSTDLERVTPREPRGQALAAAHVCDFATGTGSTVDPVRCSEHWAHVVRPQSAGVARFRPEPRPRSILDWVCLVIGILVMMLFCVALGVIIVGGVSARITRLRCWMRGHRSRRDD